jgi:hypothetical protein
MLLGPEGTGPAPCPPAPWGVGGAGLWCVSRAVRAWPVIPVPAGVSRCRAGGWGGGAGGVAWASGWPWGVCELDSGCEHLGRETACLRVGGDRSVWFLDSERCCPP